VTHACNPNYSGGRAQENPRQIVRNTLSQKKPITKKELGGVAQGEGPEFKHQYCKKKKKEGETWNLTALY
jgi:hypothetical protein